LLELPARGAARTIARLRLERAIEKAAPLLVAPVADAATTIGNEEVHGFRVALRRLRSWVRAADGLLRDDLPRPLRAALRRIARRAGAARDAQVQWMWLTAPGEPMSMPAARAARWLAADRLAAYAAARERLQRRTAAQWPPLTAALATALAPQDVSAATDDNEPLAEHLAPVLERHLASARRALDRVEHRTQVTAIHRARIEVKRLRYLVDAIGAPSTAGVRTLRHLRALQDALGDLHDAQVIAMLLEPLLAPHRGRRGSSPPRLPLRDVRALRAAVRRRELAAFRRALDLAGSHAAAALRGDPAVVARALLAGPTARQVASRATAAPIALSPNDHAPADRRG